MMLAGYDVFLSHHSADKPLIETLGERLRTRGLKAWLDKWDLRPGRPWQDGLEAGLGTARSVAVCVGASGLSAWQPAEMQAALAKSMHDEMPVIPTLLPGCPQSPALPLFLQALTWVDLRGGVAEEGLDLLVWGITGEKSPALQARGKSGEKHRRPGFATERTQSQAPAQLLLVARNLDGAPLAGFQFAYGGSRSRLTRKAGDAELKLPSGMRPGQPIKLLLVPRRKESAQWMLVNDQVNLPCEPFAAEVVLMRRTSMHEIATEARDVSMAAFTGPAQLTATDRRRVLVETAERHGLTMEQLESAVRSFAETGNLTERGIAAYLQNQLPQAEALMAERVEKREGDLVEALRYLGSTQFAQEKYEDSAASFRRALLLRDDDAGLLRWLGATLWYQAAWTEAEPVLRRALVRDEETLGPQHPFVATDLNNLAHLLRVTGRHTEAEPIVRRALRIYEQNLGHRHPNVAMCLTHLAQILHMSNRAAEVTPLLQRALQIYTLSRAEGPKLVSSLINRAYLLRTLNRSCEAEPLLRRALEIEEEKPSPQASIVAVILNSLGELLAATHRFSEAERFFRRALDIHERTMGSQHPQVAIDLNMLAQLCRLTDRPAEAEELLHRSIEIDMYSYGPQNPSVAFRLSDLAQLLKDTDRCTEAEPLLRQSLMILVKFEREAGVEHPNWATMSKDYRLLRRKMGTAEATIDVELEHMRSGD